MSTAIRLPRSTSSTVCAQSLEGRVGKILWQDAEQDGPMVLVLTTGETVKTASGSQHIQTGDTLKYLGYWTEDPKWGRQFRADAVLPAAAYDRAGAIKYLSDLCPGIGKALAKRLVAALGVDAVKTLRETPAHPTCQELLTGGVAEAASAILQQHARTEAVTMALHGLLAGRGFGARTIRAAIMHWGDNAAYVVDRNPWRLLIDSLPGAGWKRVDTLYLERGGKPESLLRQAVAGWYALREDADGSTWHSQSVFARGIVKQLAYDQLRVADALKVACKAHWAERSPEDIEPDLLADPRAASHERAIAYYLARLMRAGPPAWPLPLTPRVSDHQAEALASAAWCQVLLLCGTPGTGKTWVASELLRLVAQSQGLGEICVMATTGKAAQRITEVMRSKDLPIQATTVHRRLGVIKMGYDGSDETFTFGDSRPLPFRWVVVDEVSMLSTSLAAAVLRAVRPGSHLLLVGDQHQLPPVGHGAPLRDFLRAGVPVAQLTEVKRNGGMITEGCRLIKDGRMPPLASRLNVDVGDNVRLIHCASDVDQLDALRQVLDALRSKAGIDPIWDVAVLTPRNDAPRVGRKALNDYMRELLNPLRANDRKAAQDVWRLRDKVICLKNSWHAPQGFVATADITHAGNWHDSPAQPGPDDLVFVANGELGCVVANSDANTDCILRFEEPRRYLRVRAPKRVEHDDGTDSAREEGWALGYAMSGHKSQGSQWRYVIMILDSGGDRVASREWIYTVWSRPEVALFLLGSEATLARQIRRAELPGRKTLLVELISREISQEK